jgi:chromosome segregation ATPase
MIPIYLLDMSTFEVYPLAERGRLLKEINALYSLYTATENAGAEARDEVQKLKEEVKELGDENKSLIRDKDDICNSECDLLIERAELRERLVQEREWKEALEKEAFELQATIDTTSFGNEAIDKELHALRKQVGEMRRLNTTADNRCAQKQVIIDRLHETRVDKAEVNKLRAAIKEIGLKLIEASK